MEVALRETGQDFNLELTSWCVDLGTPKSWSLISKMSCRSFSTPVFRTLGAYLTARILSKRERENTRCRSLNMWGFAGCTLYHVCLYVVRISIPIHFPRVAFWPLYHSSRVSTVNDRAFRRNAPTPNRARMNKLRGKKRRQQKKAHGDLSISDWGRLNSWFIVHCIHIHSLTKTKDRASWHRQKRDKVNNEKRWISHQCSI